MGESTFAEAWEYAIVIISESDYQQQAVYHKIENLKYYYMISSYFQTRYTYNPGRQKVWKAICDFLGKYVHADSSVLDLGAGYCDFINNIAAKKKVAVDSDQTTERYCNTDVEFLNQKVTDIEFEDKSFDIVFASNLLEHLNDEELDILLFKVRKVLKSGGKLIIIQPNYHYAFREYWDDYSHKKAFSHISLSDFLTSKNFRIIRLERRFLPYSFKSIFPKSYFLTKLYLRSFWHPFAKQMLIIAEN
jgi:SAM-dependent methyltransferase